MTYRPPVGSGRKSDAKLILFNLRDEEGTTRLYQLSERQTKSLLDVSTYLSWLKRHETLPSDITNKDELDAWYAETVHRLMEPIEICAEIINCLENDEDTKDALRDFIELNYGDYFKDGKPMNPNNRNRELGSGFNPTCDQDIIWAQSVALVERTNALITDTIESIQEGDTIAKVAGIIAAFPVIENIGLNTITNLATFLFNIGAEIYADDYTLEWAETLECDIFCAAQTECKITFESVFNIIDARLRLSVPEFVPAIDILDIASWAAALTSYLSNLSEVNKADMFFYLIYGGLRYGDLILNRNGDQGLKLFDIALMLASDEPSNNWQVLCSECYTPLGCYDQTTVQATLVNGTWITDATYGRYAEASVDGGIAEFSIHFNQLVRLEKFSVRTKVTTGSVAWNTVKVELWKEGSFVGSVFNNTNVNDGGYNFPGRGAIDSTVGATTEFDTAKFFIQHLTGKGAIVGEVCVEAVL